MKITGNWTAAAIVLLLCVAGECQTTPTLSTEAVVNKLLENNARREAALKEYTGTRVYEVDHRGFPTGHKHARMTVHVTFEAPRKIITIVSEEGSKVLLDRVLHKLIAVEQEASTGERRHDTALSRENYGFELLGTEVKDGRECYVLRVNALRKNDLLYNGTIWVDSREFAVVRLEAQPSKEPSFWISQTIIDHTYEKIGDFWLPMKNLSTSKVRFGGKASLTIDYEEYELSRTANLETAETK